MVLKYNFDEIVSREGTYSSKWDQKVQQNLFQKTNLLPFWVADMELKTAPEIIEALRKRVEHGIFGYSERPERYYEGVINWTRDRFSWDIKKEWILFTPGVVPGINYIIQALTKEGEGVIINEPVYYPFRNSILANDRTVADSPLKLQNNRYYIDFEDLEKKAKDPNNKVYILCSPHNPVSRVWSKEELRKVGEICLKHNIYIIADEIHNDLIFSDQKHTMFASIDKSFEKISLTTTSPSKTFNLAGFYASNLIIPNDELREKVEKTLDANNIGDQGPLSIEAVMAAYEQGSDWLDELLIYLKGNIDFTKDFLNKNLPKAKVIETEGTYLMWLDFRNYEKDGEKLERLLIDKGGVALDGGTWFGESGAGFMRFNIAAPRKFIEKGLIKIADALSSHI